MVTFSKKFAIIHHSFWQLKLCSWKFMNLKMSHLEMIDFEVFSRQLLSLQQVYFSMHFVGSPSKFLARDPISDCSSRRRASLASPQPTPRRSSSSEFGAAFLYTLYNEQGAPIYSFPAATTSSLQLQNIQMTPLFINGQRKKWIMEKGLADIFEV